MPQNADYPKPKSEPRPKTGAHSKNGPKPGSSAKSGSESMSGITVFIACIATCLATGFGSLRLTDPDQGRTMTIAEFKQRRVQIAQQIRDNPNMPAQAKKIALGMMARFNK